MKNTTKFTSIVYYINYYTNILFRITFKAFWNHFLLHFLKNKQEMAFTLYFFKNNTQFFVMKKAHSRYFIIFSKIKL